MDVHGAVSIVQESVLEQPTKLRRRIGVDQIQQGAKLLPIYLIPAIQDGNQAKDRLSGMGQILRERQAVRSEERRVGTECRL